MRTVAEGQRKAFLKGSTLPLISRYRALRTMKTMLIRHGDQIAEAVGKDLGRCWTEAWSSEPGIVLADIRFVMRHLFHWHRKRLMRPSPFMIPGKAVSARVPFGTAVIIGPWNYPAGLVLAPMVSALAGGNTVILKPSERAPYTAELLQELIGRYFSSDLAAVVRGGREQAGWLIANAADIVCFTGSGATGRKVMAAASSRPIPVILELGGANPCFIAEDAHLEKAAERIAWGKFFAAGQTCLAPNHVFVHHSVHDRFLAALTAKVRQFYGEKPEDSPDYGRIVDITAWERIRPMLDKGVKACGGYGRRDDLFIAPTVLSGVPADSPLVSQEIFGPVLPVVPFDSLQEAFLYCGNGDNTPLACYGFSRRAGHMERQMKNQVRAGSITVNGTLHRITSSSIPFGGAGGSGFGRYRGREGYKNFTWHQTTLRKNPALEMPGVYPPYRIHRKFIKLMSRFL